MTRDQLVRLFPTGKTVHIPKDGQPLPGYEEAKAEILARGGSVAGYTAYASAEDGSTGRRSLWATLFGGDDEDTEYYRSAGRRRGTAVAYAPSSNSEDGGVRGLFALFRPAQPQQPEAVQASAAATEGASARETPTRAASVDVKLAGGRNGPRGSTGPGSEGADEGADAANLSPAPPPPRRPTELAAAVPLPPARPITVAGVGVVPLATPSAEAEADD